MNWEHYFSSGTPFDVSEWSKTINATTIASTTTPYTSSMREYISTIMDELEDKPSFNEELDQAYQDYIKARNKLETLVKIAKRYV